MDFHFANAFELIADAMGDRPALVCEGTTRSWTEYEDRAARLAAVLEAHGISADAKVGLYQYNCNEYAETHFAAFKLGAVPINVNYRYKAEELVYLLDNADAEALVYHGCFAPQVAAIREQLPRLKLLLQIDDGAGEALAPGAVAYEAAVADAAPRPRSPPPHADVYVLCMGGKIVGPWLARDLIIAFLQATFSTDSYFRGRLAKLEEMEVDAARQTVESAERAK